MGFFWYVLALAVGLFVGVLLGISDTKGRFAIPKGATGVDDDGFIYS